MHNYFTNIHKYLFALVVLSVLSSCTDTISNLFVGGEIKNGDEVVLNTMVPDIKVSSRTAKEQWQQKVGAYKAVNREYTFNVEMFKDNDDDNVIGSSTYKPISTDEDGNIKYNADGTLQAAENATPLYWQDNVSKWGFKATTQSSSEVEADQSDQEKWLYQDKLVGYSYLPIWNGGDDDGYETDNINQINYRTSKEWYADNQAAKELSGLMVESNNDYKKIPLYLQHQRSWVTVILKAGEGVTREALAYATSADNIRTIIYSYKQGESVPVDISQAWSREELINYESDKNGEAATGVSTTRYDAIVEPHNFIANPDSEEKDIIARISVSNQNFTFSAANDLNYHDYVAGDRSDDSNMKAYNLEPGKHLTITATLTRASRMIMITAWIEDWTETVTQTICDDYGQNGNPILINNREELLSFLTDETKNKAGNVGLIVPTSISLVDGEWDNSHTLKATLNLAGATLSVKKQFIDKIDRTGSIVNGSIAVNDAFTGVSALANDNHGTIERVRVTTSGELTPVRASKAGLVVTNYGTIYQCVSALPVYGTESGYVGGIAARNLYETENGTIPVIESCTVSARVDGTETVTAGGGIVGQAEGRVSNNTFEYGVTLLQRHQYQNIIGAIGTSSQGLTLHTMNSWPTTANYTVMNSSIVITNARTGQLYDAVVDNQLELKELLKSGYNQKEKLYRLANSFTVDKDANEENWIWGADVLEDDYFSSSTGTYSNGNVRFKLDGNDKTIALTGTEKATMLFGSILGEVYNLNITLDKPIVADRIIDTETDLDTNTDAMAAFAYAVTETGVIRNITLKSNKYIEASTPAGIVVWASHGGTLINCASNAPVRMNLIFKAGVTSTEGRHYAGGIVAVAEKATVTQCKYYGGSGSIGWVTDNQHCQQSNCRYGGVVGGTSELINSETTPSLVLSDCSSFWPLPEFDEEQTVRPVMGSLIGSTVYHDNLIVYSAMVDGNAGNWWTGIKGAGNTASGMTEEKVIGKKNSVTPANQF